jgi:hypothetical protein
MNKAIQILKRARELINQGWTKSAYARDKDGLKVPNSSSKAVCWCVEGAIYRAAYELDYDSYPSRRMFQNIYGGMVDFNDAIARNKEQVLTAFDKVIAANEKKETN